MDKTIAYQQRYAKQLMTGYPMCAILHRYDPNEDLLNTKKIPGLWTHFLWLSMCHKSTETKTYLCEFDQPLTSVERLTQSVRLATVEKFKVDHGFVFCPLNHTVRDYLACDARSACWARPLVRYGTSSESWDIPVPVTCPAPITSLPPAYACATGEQRVPYTLVCDHRQDCTDDSDENFCNHPTCEEGEFQCGQTKQVSLGGDS